MAYNHLSNIVYIENTEFIYKTNFSGDPARDEKFHSNERKGCLVIPDIEMARALIDEGFNVKMTQPREEYEDEYVPKYYVTIKLAFRNRDGSEKQWPPKVIFISDEAENELNENTVGCIDDAWVENVNVVLNKYSSDRGKSLYIKTMEVFQHVTTDPILSRRKLAKSTESEKNDISFNSDDEYIPFN